MNKALLFKEWIKTRWMFLLMFVVFILAMGYIALRISSAARNVGMPHLWEVFILKNVVLLDQIKVLPLLAGISHGNHPVYSGNDEETFQTDTASPAWREPNRVPDAKLRDGVPVTPFHGQLWWFPVGTIRGFPERSGRCMVRHDTPASIMRFRILSTYGVDYSGTRVEPANL